MTFWGGSFCSGNTLPLYSDIVYLQNFETNTILPADAALVLKISQPY